MKNNIIEVKSLSKQFKNLTAVDKVEFAVQEGELFGFLGPNGAGKSTTINMLCTLLRPSSGDATINGYRVTSQSGLVRKSIGLVFQDQSIDEELTALENLKFHANMYGVPRREAVERINSVLSMVELSDRKNDLVKFYSGGMKRRLEIARGLLHYPRVLFLDEPTIGLDPQTRKHIWEYNYQLKEQENITIFLTTHYMEEAENCDRVAIIDHGEIIALDTPDQLKQKVGGDIITVRTKDNKTASAKITERYGVEPKISKDTMQFEVTHGDEFIVRFVQDFKDEITSINLHRPTLNDVFLKLTGHAIRDEEASGADRMRSRMKRRRRR